MTTKQNLRKEIRETKVKLDAAQFGTPEREQLFARYCDLQKQLGQLELQELSR